MTTIGLIGVGEIASAIVDGLYGRPGPAPAVFLSPRNRAVGADLARRHRRVQVCADNQAVVDRAGTVILAVPRDVLDQVLDEMRVTSDRIVISAVAGASHDWLRRRLGARATVVRAIPLPAVRQRAGVTAIHPAHPEVQRFFDSLGGSLVIDDAETLTAIQTSTAAISTHLHYLQAVATWLAGRGVAEADAERYVRSMVLGVNAGLGDPTRTLSELVASHETPQGINEQLRRTWFTPQHSPLTHALDEVYARLDR